MYHYKGKRLEITNVAYSILTDTPVQVPLKDLIVIQERIYEHITGKRPIDGERWLKREQRKEKKASR